MPNCVQPVALSLLETTGNAASSGPVAAEFADAEGTTLSGTEESARLTAGACDGVLLAVAAEAPAVGIDFGALEHPTSHHANTAHVKMRAQYAVVAMVGELTIGAMPSSIVCKFRCWLQIDSLYKNADPVHQHCVTDRTGQ